MLIRILVGFLIALAIAIVARRVRSLSTSGAIAAIVVGTIAIAAGWNWGALLIVYFISASALSRMGRDEKEQFTSTIVAKGDERDAAQVFANGGAFAIAALAMCIHPDVRWAAFGVAALAASAADTWATEIGTLYGGRPRLILTWRRVPPGTSGGITLIGTIAMIAGASFLGIVARIAGWDIAVTNPAVLGGIGGAILDSVLGATMQSRRWCESCQSETERVIHHCGTKTSYRRGFGWLDNDVVNFVSSVLGGLLAAYLVG
ncbi:MAG TPA: DUF92 domain-containing protein [Gemmatimonadaceae bacterium]